MNTDTDISVVIFMDLLLGGNQPLWQVINQQQYLTDRALLSQVSSQGQQVLDFAVQVLQVLPFNLF